VTQPLCANHLLSILSSFPDPVFLLTRSGRYGAVYGGTDSRYYHDGTGLIGKTLHEVLRPEKADWFLGEIARALNLPGLQIMEYGLAAGDVLGLSDTGPAQTIWFEGRVQRLNFQIDGEDAVLWVASNITHKRTVEVQLSEALRRERDAINTMWQRMTEKLPAKKTQARWTLNMVAGELRGEAGERVALTGMETQLLACLAEMGGVTVEKTALCARLYPGEPVDPDRVNVSLSRLRRKLVEQQCGLAIRSLFGKGLALSEAVDLQR
jgi:hypothetical protein